MKCEIKFLKNKVIEIPRDFKATPIKMIMLFLIAVVITIPLNIWNETKTPDTDYINIIGLGVTLIILWASAHNSCKKH